MGKGTPQSFSAEKRGWEVFKKIKNSLKGNVIRIELIGFVIISIFLSACGSGGGGASSPPPPIIGDISQILKTRGTISWTAPIDGGAGSSYDVRISENPIDENNFESATVVQNVPVPGSGILKDQLTIPGLDIDKTYYVSIKTTDSSGKQSDLSDPFFFTTILEQISFSGSNSGETFGSAVASSGDVNGDGIPDIIVGAPFRNAFKGAVFIYLGGQTISSSPITLEGSQNGEKFGSSVSGGKDVNNDGCSDIIVGAFEHSSMSLTKNGRAYVYFGSGSPPCPSSINSTFPDVILEGVVGNEQFGFSVAGMGDINDDQIPEILIGAPGSSIASSNPGHAYIFFGSDSLLGSINASSANITLTGTVQGDRFGYAVSGGGDIDGDQVPDLAVGATIPSPIAPFGAAYLFSGGGLNADRVASSAEVVFTGAAVNDQLGWTLTIMGDMNGDNLSDLAVGTRFPDGEKGAVYLFFSGSGFVSKNTSLADVILTGINTGDQFGWVVADGGDINLDGVNDLIVGARLATSQNSSSLDTGVTYIFYGGPALLNKDASMADVELGGVALDDEFGYSVAGIGDTNGDGYPEIAVGARFSDNNPLIDNGAVYIYR